MRHVFSKSLSILLIVSVSLLFVSCSKKTSSVNNSSNYDYELSEEHIVTDDETGLQYVNNILIVYFKDSASDSDVSSVVSDVNGKIVGQYSESNQIQIEVPVKDMSELESLCDSLMERDYVDYCTYDYVYQNDAKELIPNDTWDNYSSNWSKRDSTANWGQIAVEAPAAWALCSNNTSETVVGVVDSGIDVHHEDFEGKVSSVSDNSIPEEHGTHVTGIIGAVGNNHIGIAGMDWKAKILGYDCFLGQEKTSSIKILNGLETVVRNGAKVINLSIGSSNNWESHKVDIPRSAYYRQAEDASRTLGRLLKEGFDFIVVQSAGNGAKDYIGIDAYFNGHFCSVDKETCFKGYGNMDDILNRIIIVGNAELSGNEFRQSISSNGGSQVSIYAPGTSILSSIENNDYKLLSGTSMAAPFVTGIASLVWSENPDLNGAEVKRAICDDSNTVYSVANNPGNASYGEGRMVNAYRAVKSVSDDKSDEPKIYRDTENSLNDEAIEQHLQINEFALRDKCVITIKNNTKQNLYMQFIVSFFDESGNEIDNDLDFTLSVASGDDMAFLSSCEREYDHAKYSLDVHPTDDPPAPLDLSIVDNSNEVLVIAENNGASETQDPVLVTLFFKGDQLVDAKKVVGSISAVDNWVATKLVVPIDSIDENTRREYYLHADPFILSPE